MHLLDEEELPHVGKILRKGYVRVDKPKKKTRVKGILFCVLFSLLALLFLALSAYCVYWVINGLYLIVAFPGFIVSAVFSGICLRESHLSLEGYMPPLGSKTSHVKYPPNFLIDPFPQADSLSHQSSTIFYQSSSKNQSLRNFTPEETSLICQSTSDDDVVKYSTSEEAVHFEKDPKIVRSVSQYAVDNVPNQDQMIVKPEDQSSFSSSRKRFSHNFEPEEGIMDRRTLPSAESSISVSTKVHKMAEKGSSLSLPAIKLMSNTDA